MGVVPGSGVGHRSSSVQWRPLQGLRVMLQIKERKWVRGYLGPGDTLAAESEIVTTPRMSELEGGVGQGEKGPHHGHLQMNAQFTSS